MRSHQTCDLCACGSFSHPLLPPPRSRSNLLCECVFVCVCVLMRAVRDEGVCHKIDTEQATRNGSAGELAAEVGWGQHNEQSRTPTPALRRHEGLATMASLSPDQMAALQSAMAAQAGAGAGKSEITLGGALQQASTLTKDWGSKALLFGSAPLLFYAGMRACNVTVTDIVVSVFSLPLA